MDDFKHYTVMLNEAVDALECEKGKIYVDCTLGGGGHSELILKRISPNGRLISFDIDDEAIRHAKERLKDYSNLTIIKSSYTNIKAELQKLGIEKITGGVILD
ncbi:16S rRNA (cytosine(1402)-N(4))-methyltransferase, partial [bacterium]|nr:16S rRNA (cytosine(1402)-N(4))-methyltransferase [bacterium]